MRRITNACTALGATNTVPAFITANGPIREARFKANADASPDGGVHALFVISGRSDSAAGCHIAPSTTLPGGSASITRGKQRFLDVG
jgi:hypothetical protein